MTPALVCRCQAAGEALTLWNEILTLQKFGKLKVDDCSAEDEGTLSAMQ